MSDGLHLSPDQGAVLEALRREPLRRSSDWPVLTLGDAGVRLIDCIHKTPPAQDSGYPYVAIPQMKGGRLDFESARRISHRDFLVWTMKARPQPHDVVLSRRTNPGVTAVDRTGTEFALGQNLVLLRADGSRVEPAFLKWLVRSPAWWREIGKYLNVGALFDSLRCADVQHFELPVPPMPVQLRIGALLDALDDRIELNRRMNETLEAMARALFKSWFVDFEPARAKMAGHDTGLAHAIADRFPARLNEHRIPEGWRRPQLGQMLTVLETGRRPRGGVANITEGIPSVGAESIVKVGHFDFSKTKYVPREYYDSMSKGRVLDGDVLIYKDGGKPGELRPAVTYVSGGFPFPRFCVNEHVFRVRTSALSQQMLYMALSTDDALWQMRELATGVAQPGLNQSALRSLRITMPNDGVLLQHAGAFIDPLLDRCNRNSIEGHKLASVRDLLLPRLISGELRVKQAEKVVAEIL